MHRHVIKLGRWYFSEGGFRFVLGLIGLALIVVATVWAWPAPPDAVILAALGVGTLLLYLSYSGQMLLGLKAGGVEGTFTEVVRAVSGADVPADVKAEVRRIVESGQAPLAARQEVQQFTPRHQMARDYEDRVRRALVSAFDHRHWKIEDLPSGGPFDFSVSEKSPPYATVRVECRWSDQPNQALLDDWRCAAELQSGARLGYGIVLVVSRLPEAGQETEGLVVWNSGADDGKLREAVLDAFPPPFS